tara:strand:+ start:1361 stop:2353 length:993 start_codon:yes stop_codon:yes gene_type:complete
MESIIRIGVLGATGYGGQELLRFSARHSNIEVTLAMSSHKNEENRTLSALTGICSKEIEPLSLDKIAKNTDAVFLALPENASAEILPEIAKTGIRVFDLSGSFRLNNPNLRKKWYPDTPELEIQPVYGLTERKRIELRDAKIIACPGCYPTAALLALEPLVSANFLDGEIVIDAKSGISGAGKKPSERTHFSECDGNVSAYGIFAHRHTAEMEQELGKQVTFVPHLVPLNRGLIATIYTHVKDSVTYEKVSAIYEDAYTESPFVRLRREELPEIKYVTNTNFCDIGWRLDKATNRLIIVSCLDNLIKGAAGQALQNFNVVYGLDEQTGLL